MVKKIQYKNVRVFNLISFLLMVIASLFPFYSYSLKGWYIIDGNLVYNPRIYIYGIVFTWPSLVLLLIANILIFAKTAKNLSAILVLIGNIWLIFMLVLLPFTRYRLEFGWLFLNIVWVISLTANIFLFKVDYGLVPKQIYQQPIQQIPIQKQPNQQKKWHFCPNCGAEVIGNFCSECGTHIK